MNLLIVDVGLIDDDPLIHAVWSISAEIHGKCVAIFETAEQFFRECANFSSITPIYVDSNLGNGVKGEVISEKISQKGFKYIYLQTGNDACQFEIRPWLSGIMSKSPPWE